MCGSGYIEHAGTGGGFGLGGLRCGRKLKGELRLVGGDLRGFYLHGAQAFEVCQAFEEAGEGGGGVFFHGLAMATGGDGEYVVLRGGERYKFYAVHGAYINVAL